MAITKEIAVDQITVTGNGIVLVRETTKIIEDGNEISKQYHRTSLTPGQNLANQPANVVAIANAVWTPEVIAAYKASSIVSTRSGPFRVGRHDIKDLESLDAGWFNVDYCKTNATSGFAHPSSIVRALVKQAIGGTS